MQLRSGHDSPVPGLLLPSELKRNTVDLPIDHSCDNLHHALWRVAGLEEKSNEVDRDRCVDWPKYDTHSVLHEVVLRLLVSLRQQLWLLQWPDLHGADAAWMALVPRQARTDLGIYHGWIRPGCLRDEFRVC